MKPPTTTLYQCKVCEQWYRRAIDAQRCEASPKPKLTVGDVVLWRGRRDDPLQTMVYDWVTAIERDPTTPDGHIGHEYTFILSRDFAVDDHSLPPRRQQHGAVSLAEPLGTPLLHTDRLESVLQDVESISVLESLVAWLIERDVPLHPRIGTLYLPMLCWIYRKTWDRRSREFGTFPQYRVAAGFQTLFIYLTREISDDECLAFLGIDNTTVRCFDHDVMKRTVGFWQGDIPRMLTILSQSSNAELAQLVQQYRESVILGTATYSSPDTLKWLFPLNERQKKARWIVPIRDFAKAQGIAGRGQRHYEEAIASFYQKAGNVMNPGTLHYTTHLFTDRPVIAVMSNKGGVGKTSVCVALARQLKQRGYNPLILDADFYGPNVHVMLNDTTRGIQTTNQKMLPHVVNGIEVLSLAYLMEPDEALEWKGIYLQPLLHLFALHTQTNADVILIDMPPGTGDTFHALTELIPHAYSLLVTTASPSAVADLQRAITGLTRNQRSRVIGILENLAGTLASGEYLWGGTPASVPQLAESTKLSFLGALPMADQAQIDHTLGTLMHRILHSLNDQQYHVVDSIVIEQAADQFISQQQVAKRIADQRLKRFERPEFVSAIFALETAIRQQGGNPNDPRYRSALHTALTRLRPYTNGDYHRPEPNLAIWWHTWTDEG